MGHLRKAQYSLGNKYGLKKGLDKTGKYRRCVCLDRTSGVVLVDPDLLGQPEKEEKHDTDKSMGSNTGAWNEEIIIQTFVEAELEECMGFK